MAAIGSKSFQFLLQTCNPYSTWLNYSCHRFYAIFAPSFKEPTFIKSEIEKLLQEKPEDELLASNVKPPTGSQTCSLLYHPDVEQFTNYLLKKGKRDVARTVVKDTLRRIKHIQIRKYNTETDPEKKKDILLSPIDVFSLAVKNVTPVLWFLKVKRSGTWYKVPVGITEAKAKEAAMKWLLEVAINKDGKIPLEVELANEIVSAASYEGKAIAKKLEMHKMCEANRGYVNYWWT